MKLTGYLICGQFEYSQYVLKGMLPQNHYRRAFYTSLEEAEHIVNQRSVRNLLILEFRVPKRWIDYISPDNTMFECIHELKLRRYLKHVY